MLPLLDVIVGDLREVVAGGFVGFWPQKATAVQTKVYLLPYWLFDQSVTNFVLFNEGINSSIIIKWISE